MEKELFLNFKTYKSFVEAVNKYEKLGYVLTFYYVTPGDFQATFRLVEA